MQSNIYVGLSAQLALQQRVDTVANNLANSSTAGFRGEEVSFEALLSRSGTEPVNYASSGASYFSRSAGDVTVTGNSLDVAVSGEAWLSVNTPQGRALTRDGRMQIATSGELQTVTGQPLLDPGGSPIQLDASAGPLAISRDGTITQAGRRVGILGLFQLGANAKLTRAENSALISDQPPLPITDVNASGVIQGHVEKSNVNPVKEMTRLIALQRTFESITNAMNSTETALQDAVRALGSGS